MTVHHHPPSLRSFPPLVLVLFFSSFLLAVAWSAIRSTGGSGTVSTTTTGHDSPFSQTEQLFLSIPQAPSARDHLYHITRIPHVAGTFGDSVLAEYVQDVFSQQLIPDVNVFELQVLLNYPSERPIVQLWKPPQPSNDTTSPVLVYKARLEEALWDDTSDTFWRNHTFHGYSPSGNVTAPMVFANYGRPSDFAALEQQGDNTNIVNNTIVVMRYGKCFRGLKVRNAQQRGAVGVILYSDPADDGYGQGEVYPDGPWRPKSGVQRGSVQFNSACAGDPMRADPRYVEQNETLQSICGIEHYRDWIPKIPSLPISYEDALPLLQHMGGMAAVNVFGKEFDGGLTDLEYTVGPSSDVVVQLTVTNHETITTIPNVVGHIPGSLPPELDTPVLLGNHRDAWVYGAADPNSGTAALLEVARGLGQLVETGWTPRRSIYLLSWSGEEYGLLGSTGWAELNRDKIQRAVAYLNVDTVVSGDILSVETTPSLSTLWEHVLDDLYNSLEHRVEFENGPTGDVRDANTNWLLNKDRPVERLLGSGSDYTVFLDHFGISSLDFSFGKKTTYGQYHSIYDSFAWMDAFGGIDGETGSAFDLIAFGAKIWGLLALRLADSPVLPLNHVVQGEAMFNYTTAIQDQRCGLDLTSLKAAVHRYQQAADSLQAACTGDSPSVDEQTCNEKLGLTERRLLAESGLPGRPWFKHILQAPGMDLGYAAEAFPGIQQAVDDGDLELAEQQVRVAAELIEGAAATLSVSRASSAARVAR